LLIEREVEKVRTIIAFKHYFEDFFTKLPVDARKKVFKVEVTHALRIKKEYFEEKNLGLL